MDNQCLCRIRGIYKAITRFETELDRLFGLNMNECMLLCMLQDGQPMLAKDIAGRMELTRSNTSKVIDTLLKREYIERKESADDYRCRFYRITEKGLQLLTQIHSDRLAVPEELCRYLPDMKP